ncbi:NUDIX hydrolase [Amycolatopsis sp. WAC 01375]|uniref:NUDIX hydrolase n=1 Tax=Amycolatopsis sp. WAC 01375 TaxID=2203194 RepID=UPI000F76A44E|nr:NUDIX hydrolase [Amycolatopsis sp. WAC 01375]
MTVFPILDRDAQLVPDADCWGHAFGDRGYPAETLTEIAGYVSGTVQPGYGLRLFETSPGYRPAVGDECAILPSGFDASGHPNRTCVEPAATDPDFVTASDSPIQLDDGLRRHFTAQGWVRDQHGRPLHPHHQQLIADPRIGLPTGIGFFHFYGDNPVVDVVVTSPTGRVLLITRATADGTIPALPGGYAIPSDFGRTASRWRAGDRLPTLDGLIAAGARKLAEETGLVVPGDATVRIVRAIRPISSPHTINAWTTTYTLRVDLPTSPSPLHARPTVAWHDGDHLLEHGVPGLWPDHRAALRAALG